MFFVNARPVYPVNKAGKKGRQWGALSRATRQDDAPADDSPPGHWKPPTPQARRVLSTGQVLKPRMEYGGLRPHQARAEGTRSTRPHHFAAPSRKKNRLESETHDNSHNFVRTTDVAFHEVPAVESLDPENHRSLGSARRM